jgi:hypothetical protein
VAYAESESATLVGERPIRDFAKPIFGGIQFLARFEPIIQSNDRYSLSEVSCGYIVVTYLLI